MVVALLTAAGLGERMRQDIPKQFMLIENKPLIIYTMEAFQKHPSIDAILTVTLPDWEELLKAYANHFSITKLRWIVKGGKTNQDSICNGLRELEKYCKGEDIIVIHDGNRCFVADEIISDSLATFYKYGSAVAAIPCREAIFSSEDEGISSTTFLPRERLVRTQTPHTYSLEKLLWAHNKAKEEGIENTVATCTLMQLLGERIFFSRGSEENLKITTVDDLKVFRGLLYTKKAEKI